MRTLAIILPLLLVSCAGPDAARRIQGVMPPMKKPSVELRVMDVEDAARQVDRSNQALQREVVDLKVTAQEASGAASRAESKVARLLEQKQANEEELVELSAITKEVVERNKTLEAKVIELEDQVLDQATLIVHQDQKLATARAAGAEKDLEVENAHRLIDEANHRTELANEEVTKAQKAQKRMADELSAAKEEAARNAVYRTGVLWVGWLAAAAVGIYLFIRFCLPWVLRAFRGGL